MGEAMLENCKKTLRSCLLCEKHGIKVAFIEKDYYNISGEKMPYREFGYRTAVDFIEKRMSDTARISMNPDGDRVFVAVADQSTQHIASMVKCQRSKKKRKRGGFGFSSSNRFAGVNSGGRWPRDQNLPRGGRNLSSYNGQKFNQSGGATGYSNYPSNAGSHRRPATTSGGYSKPSTGYSQQDSSAYGGRPITGSKSSNPFGTTSKPLGASSNQFGASANGFTSGNSRPASQDWHQSMKAQGDYPGNGSGGRMADKSEAGWGRQGGDNSTNQHTLCDQTTKYSPSCDSSGCSESGKELTKEDLRWMLREKHAKLKSGQLNQATAPTAAGNQTREAVALQNREFSAPHSREALAPQSKEAVPQNRELSRPQAKEATASQNSDVSGPRARVVPTPYTQEVPPRFLKAQESSVSSVVTDYLHKATADCNYTAASRDSQQSIVCDRVLAILKPKPQGIWAKQLSVFYKDKYAEEAPSNLHDILRNCPDIEIEMIGNLELVLPRLVTTDPVLQPQSTSNVQAPMYNPATNYTSFSTPASGRPAAPSAQIGTVKSKIQRPPEHDGPQDVFISFVNSTVDIALRLIGPQYSEKLLELESVLVTGKFPLCRTASRGGLYIHLTQDNGVMSACRLLVHQRNDGSQYGEYVDHGDFCERIEPSTLYELPPALNTLPYQGIRCRLTGLEMFENDERGFDLLDKHALGITCKARFDQRDEQCISVTLWNENGVLNEELSYALLSPQLKQIGHTTSAYVSYISHTGSIYLNIPGIGFDRLSALSEDLQKVMQNTRSARHLERYSEPGTLCLALASSSGQWSRAEIVDYVSDTQQAIVHYVDYGDQEYVKDDSIYEITVADEELVKLPFQAILCQLRDLPPSNSEWTDTGLNLLAELVPSDRPVNVLTVSVGTAGSSCSGEANEDSNDDIVIIDISTDLLPSVCDYLRQRQDIWQREDSSDVIGEVADQVMSRLGVSEAPGLTSPRAVPHPANNDIVYITWARDPFNFRAIPQQYYEELNHITTELQICMASENNNGKALAVDEIGNKQLYAGRHDTVWYRIKVVAALPSEAGTGMYRVQFVDYGDATAMSLANIHYLPEKFCYLPMLAIKMKLAVNTPMGEMEWSDEVARIFCEIVLEKTFRVEVVAESHSEMCVRLYHSETNEAVHESIVL